LFLDESFIRSPWVARNDDGWEEKRRRLLGDVFIREDNADYPCECQMKCGLKCDLIDTGYPPESCIFIAVDDVLLSESGAQGSRRPPDGWPSRPLHLPRPPFIPPRGNSRPPTPQNKVCRRRARAFLCSSPVTPPAFSLCRAQARASPAISAVPLSGSVFKGVPEDLDATLKGSANIWFTEERNLEATVLIDTQVSHYFKRRTMFPTQEIKEERPDGPVRGDPEHSQILDPPYRDLGAGRIQERPAG